MPLATRHSLIGLAIACGILASGVASTWFWFRHDALHTKQAEVTRTILSLEHATGYSGFIHDFKNAVLRPLEPVYIQRALSDYDMTLQALAELEGLAQSEGISIDLTFYRKTLQTYRDKLEILRDHEYDAQQIAETDALVRVPDDAARASLDQVTQKLTRALSDKITPIRRALAASLAVFVALVTLLIREQAYSARVREQRALVLNQQNLLEVERRHRRELSSSLNQLRQTTREQAEFTYAISHDLKAPTNTALMLVRAFREDLDIKATPEETEMLDDLEAVLMRMNGLIEDMLEYTRTLSSELPRSDVSLDRALDEVLDNLRADIRDRGASIRRMPLPHLRANPMQMRNLLQNLLQNALKFHLPDCRPDIEVGSAEADHGDVAFYVRDNGIGIPKDQSEKVFSLFGRLHGREVYEGSGLGLPICLRIAQTHGGTISVDSTEGVGTTFTVTMRSA